MSNKLKTPIDSVLSKELARQRGTIELIASENFVSENVLRINGSILTNKYAEGYPGARYYNGCHFIDEVEQTAINYVKKLFGAKFANVQPHSGSQANFAAYASVLKIGDKILSMNLNCGGHLTHGSPVNFSGKLYKFTHYSVNKETELLDYSEIQSLALNCKPKLIIAGYSNYSRTIDFKKFREIADSVGAYLLVDMAHVAGLIAAGYFPNPFPHADIVTSTTQKTLRGPRGGFIMTNNAELAKKIDFSVFPGNQGGPSENIIGAKAVCFYEALQPSFKKYIGQVIKNAREFAKEFLKNGYHVVAGGTDSHLFSINVFSKHKITGNVISNWLEKANITVNMNTIPFDTNPPKSPSGIRVGTSAMTTRGFKSSDFVKLAQIMISVFNSQGKPSKIAYAKKQANFLLSKLPVLYKNF